MSIEAAVLVGHSFAGGLAIDFCLERPSRVLAVVAEAPALGGFNYSAAFKERSGRIFAAYRTGGAEAAAAAVLADPFLAPRNAGARERLRAIVIANIDRLFSADPGLARSPEPPAIERLEDFGRPLLLVAAEHDDTDNQAVADLLEQRVANARSVKLSGVGHNAHLDAPEQFNEVLLDFVREVAAC